MGAYLLGPHSLLHILPLRDALAGRKLSRVKDASQAVVLALSREITDISCLCNNDANIDGVYRGEFECNSDLLRVAQVAPGSDDQDIPPTTS